MTEAAPPDEIPPRVVEYLGAHTTLTLATSSPSGVPRATDLRYVNDGPKLYVWTRSESWTAKQIEQNPLVSFTVSEEDTGLQGSGEARLVLGGAEVARAVELFSTKFPTALGSSTMNISFFRIAPTDLKLVGESYGGGRGETRMFSGAEYRVDHVYNVLSDLPATDIGLVVGKLQRLEVAAGEVIARQGAPADKFVVVLDGEVAVTREADGEQEAVATLGPGDFFGEVAIVVDVPRSATLWAVTPCTLLTMERDGFRSVVAQALGTVGDFDRIVRERLDG